MWQNEVIVKEVMRLVEYLIKNYGSWSIFYSKYYGLSGFKFLCECVILVVSEGFKRLQTCGMFASLISIESSTPLEIVCPEHTASAQYEDARLFSSICHLIFFLNWLITNFI